MQLDPLLLQLSAHWRIYALIAARDTMSLLFGKYREAAHERTTNTQYMNMHG